MRYILLFFAALIVFSCRKQHDANCSPVMPAAESASIASFCRSNGINYTIDTNDIYYQVLDPGTGSRPKMSSVITATYKTSLLSGQIIDTSHLTTPVVLPLSQFIEGLRIAIPYIQKGGHIKMVIPSFLAYGCTGIDNLVPGNSPLYYDFLLLDISN